MEALAMAVALLVITLGAMVVRTVRRHTRAQRRAAGRAVIHFPTLTLGDPARPGPDLGTLSWLIFQGIDA